jgi:phage terminase large subunit
LVKVAVDKKNKKIYVDECYYERKQLGTDDIAAINKSRIAKSSDLIVADDHGQQNRLVYDLARAGLNIKGSSNYTRGAASLITQILDYQIIVTPNSNNIRKELSNYCWNDKKAGIPIDDYNHSIDALIYAYASLTQTSLSLPKHFANR